MNDKRKYKDDRPNYFIKPLLLLSLLYFNANEFDKAIEELIYLKIIILIIKKLLILLLILKMNIKLKLNDFSNVAQQIIAASLPSGRSASAPR